MDEVTDGGHGDRRVKAGGSRLLLPEGWVVALTAPLVEIASKYCISDSFVDHDGHSISSEGFLPAVVDIMVI